MNSNELATTLETFANGMRWVLERKDMNAFWPVGIPSAATAGAPSLLDVLEPELGELAERSPIVPNPTSVLALYLYLIHGVRESGWNLSRRLRLADALFTVMKASKLSPTLNGDGTHRLVRRLASGVEPRMRELRHVEYDEHARALHELAATTWAYGETIYFYNHRLATERHGPYASGEQLVRSAYNLDSSVAWPEHHRSVELPHAMDIVACYAGLELPLFDMYSNPVFTADVNKSVRSIGATIVFGARVDDNPSTRVVMGVTEALRSELAYFVATVRAMSERERTRKMFRIMVMACHQLDTAAAVQPATGFECSGDPPGFCSGHPVEGNPRELAEYYDLRREWP